MVERRMLRRRVIMPVYVGIFEEFFRIQPTEKLQLGDVIVSLSLVVAVLFFARGRADRVPQVQLLLELARNGALANPTGAAEDDQETFLIFLTQRSEPVPSTDQS